MLKASIHTKAVSAIDARGILLVYPLKNKPEPRSLWSELFPRSKMVWTWDANADNRVAKIWHLKEELSRSSEVVYTKWYQNRATFFSKNAYINMRAALNSAPSPLTRASQELIEILETDSPLSTKDLKRAAGLEGRLFEGDYNKAMKALWQRLEIVGFGEVEDSSFPSMAIGHSSLIFEDLVQQSKKTDPAKAWDWLKKHIEPSFLKFAKRIKPVS